MIYSLLKKIRHDFSPLTKAVPISQVWTYCTLNKSNSSPVVKQRVKLQMESTVGCLYQILYTITALTANSTSNSFQTQWLIHPFQAAVGMWISTVLGSCLPHVVFSQFVNMKSCEYTITPNISVNNDLYCNSKKNVMGFKTIGKS